MQRSISNMSHPTQQTEAAFVIPTLRYRDGQRTLAWLTEAFGLQPHFQAAGPDNSIAHAQMTLGQGMVMLSAGGKPDASNPWCQVTHGVYFYVPDIEAQYRRAQQAGAEIVIPLRQTDYGSREFSVRDFEGHLWSFGTYQPWIVN
jgi:uncharacterized glyoxalase superfamily protein PhnB